MDEVLRAIEIQRFVTGVKELRRRRHGDRLPKFGVQLKALSELYQRRHPKHH